MSGCQNPVGVEVGLSWLMLDVPCITGYQIRVRIQDHTDGSTMTIFGQEAETLIKHPASELEAMLKSILPFETSTETLGTSTKETKPKRMCSKSKCLEIYSYNFNETVQTSDTTFASKRIRKLYQCFYWLSEIRLAFLIMKPMDSNDQFNYNKDFDSLESNEFAQFNAQLQEPSYNSSNIKVNSGEKAVADVGESQKWRRS
ncbi:hypothetical protein IFM89_003962 [Coptis chinensis]|uniref:Replication factor A C-terminal domain-containing protein n=1 Tax=Coptis chinensis TaxID=261450 RepID=A0A835LGW7_9MAGN|nr:hypothetical protein IFM89_003962 [Coptis chinensis]